VGAQCNNPATCTQNVTLTTNSPAGNSGSFVPNGAFPATINFRFTTANAEAPFFFSYADAGQITLQFRTALPSPPAGVFVSGMSNAFVTRPFGFAFHGANAATLIQHGTLPTSTLLAAAGDNFTMTVAAYRWAASEDDGTGNPLPGADITDNGLTPNFAFATTVSATGNLPGTATGAVSRGVGCAGAATIAAGSWSGGAATIGDWCYSEAGNAFFSAAAADYIAVGVNVSGNSGLDGTGAAGGYVGRFRPKHFALDTSLGNAPILTDRAALLPCASTFSYMGEGMRLTLRLLAQNTQGATTQNYNGVYAMLSPNPIGGPNAAFVFGARSGTTNLTSRLSASYPGAVPAWASGVLNIPLSDPVHVTVGRATPDNPDGPYTGTLIGIAPVDSDAVAMNTLDFDADGNTVNERRNLGVSGEVRFGRLAIRNANGSQIVPLPIRVEAQYWSGAPTNAFITNTADGCTAIAATNIEMSNYTPNLNACETSLTVGAFASGRATALLAAPGSANNGSVILTPRLEASVGVGPTTCIGGVSTPLTGSNRAYLMGRWDAVDQGGDGFLYDDNPTARATFGVFQGSEEVIFIRENF